MGSGGAMDTPLGSDDSMDFGMNSTDAIGSGGTMIPSDSAGDFDMWAHAYRDSGCRCIVAYACL